MHAWLSQMTQGQSSIILLYGIVGQMNATTKCSLMLCDYSFKSLKTLIYAIKVRKQAQNCYSKLRMIIKNKETSLTRLFE